MTKYDRYQRRLFGDFEIKSGDLVLDVGCGDEPFPLATHLIDKFSDDNRQRSGGKLVTDGKPFSICDVEDIKGFSNKYFDFVYCSHVLEHCNNPEKACSELTRVGKRGFIETPSKMGEVMFGDKEGVHKWYVSLIDKKLIFEKIKYSQPFGDLFYSMICSNDEYHYHWTNLDYINLRFYRVFLDHPELFFTMFVWSNTFEYLVL